MEVIVVNDAGGEGVLRDLASRYPVTVVDGDGGGPASEGTVAERDGLADHVTNLEHHAKRLETIVADLRRFEERVKGTLAYKIYRRLRLHRLFSKSSASS